MYNADSNLRVLASWPVSCTTLSRLASLDVFGPIILSRAALASQFTGTNWPLSERVSCEAVERGFCVICWSRIRLTTLESLSIGGNTLEY